MGNINFFFFFWVGVAHAQNCVSDGTHVKATLEERLKGTGRWQGQSLEDEWGHSTQAGQWGESGAGQRNQYVCKPPRQTLLQCRVVLDCETVAAFVSILYTQFRV